MVSIDQHDTVDDWEQAAISSGRVYLPVGGTPTARTPEELATSATVQHVLDLMSPARREVLRMYFAERMTMRDISEELGGISESAVSQRVTVAKQEFIRLWAAHANDEIDWSAAI